MFDNELIIYEKILPCLDRLESEHKFEKRLSTPKVFYVNSEDVVILMNNLKEENYSMMDKIKGKSFQISSQHCYKSTLIERIE